MVANRAVAPSSKLHMEHWVTEEAYIEGLPQVEVHTLYRAMDFLLEAAEQIQHDIFFSVANLFNLEVDVLFLDTTTTYFEIEGEDPDLELEGEVVAEGLRKWGRESKDSRPNLAQVVIAFAVTRTGIPVRCWVWPGNTVDQDVVEEVKRDLNSWELGRVVLVEDAGFNSAKNRRTLQGTGGHYIIGGKMRAGNKGEAVPAIRRGGRYGVLDGDLEGLKFKHVVIGKGEARRCFVVVHNPEEAARDRAKRADIVADVENQLEELKQLEGEPHRKKACELRAHPVYGRYIRQTRTGKLSLNKAKIKTEEHFDGRFLVSTSDDTLSPEDIVRGYKQLAVIERVFQDMKHLIDMRPVRHRLPERIQAHVLLCWLAMLLIRVAENESHWTWFQMKKALATLQVGMHRMRSGGEIWETNPVQAQVKELFASLGLKLPGRYLKLPVPKEQSA
ncbi:MAG: IS1634 family transposase [Firmicutes bacterium]|nr:IS1634 family transposase [Bacillota bacterium]